MQPIGSFARLSTRPEESLEHWTQTQPSPALSYLECLAAILRLHIFFVQLLTEQEAYAPFLNTYPIKVKYQSNSYHTQLHIVHLRVPSGSAVK